MALHLRDDRAIRASLHRALLAAPPGAARDGVWLFAYGALAAAPDFPHAERRAAVLRGHRRAFSLHDPLYRGTEERPGLVLGLDPGGEAEGFAYRVDAGRAEDALLPVWRQEMKLPWYVPAWLHAATAGGPLCVLSLLTDPASPHLATASSDEAVAATVARAEGGKGTNADYLRDTVDAFAAGGVRDPYLDRLLALVDG